MRQKFITALSLFFVLSLLFSVQLTHASQVSAHEFDNDDESHTHPVTNPVTGPVTGPITGPVSNLFTISGTVTDHIFGLFKHGLARFIPASGVTVKALDIFKHTTVTTTTTDSNGDYTLNPGKAGWYQVQVSGGQASYYIPFSRFVNDNKPAGVQHVNFEGVLLKF